MSTANRPDDQDRPAARLSRVLVFCLLALSACGWQPL
jgi:hypothetical protein